MPMLQLDGKPIALLDEDSVELLNALAVDEPGYVHKTVSTQVESARIEHVTGDVDAKTKKRLTKIVTATIELRFMVEREWDERSGVRPSRKNPTVELQQLPSDKVGTNGA